MEFDQRWNTATDGSRELLTVAILKNGQRVGPVRVTIPLEVGSDFRTYWGEGLEKMLETSSKIWLADLISHSGMPQD